MQVWTQLATPLAVQAIAVTFDPTKNAYNLGRTAGTEAAARPFQTRGLYLKNFGMYSQEMEISRKEDPGERFRIGPRVAIWRALAAQFWAGYRETAGPANRPRFCFHDFEGYQNLGLFSTFGVENVNSGIPFREFWATALNNEGQAANIPPHLLWINGSHLVNTNPRYREAVNAINQWYVAEDARALKDAFGTGYAQAYPGAMVPNVNYDDGFWPADLVGQNGWLEAPRVTNDLGIASPRVYIELGNDNRLDGFTGAAKRLEATRLAIARFKASRGTTVVPWVHGFGVISEDGSYNYIEGDIALHEMIRDAFIERGVTDLFYWHGNGIDDSVDAATVAMYATAGIDT